MRVLLAPLPFVALMAACPSSSCGEGDAWWQPATGTTWQITLSVVPTTRDQDVEAWDLDLFDTPAATIELLQAGGTRVICYFSAGTFEPGRPDEASFPARVLGNAYEDPAFVEERYLDVTDDAVLGIMAARMDLAVNKGCDAVDPDNVDLFDHDTGFDITEAEMRDFNLALAAAAHARGLAIGLKNDMAQLADVASAYQFAVNEECFAFDECDVYLDNFLADGKPVFHIEYVESSQAAAVCAVTEPLGLSTVIKSYELDAPVTFCP